MFKMRTLMAILFSIIMGFLAIGALSMVKKTEPVEQKPMARVEKKEKKKSEPLSFSDAIPKGMRITTIKVNEVSGVTRALQKNDRVDIIAITSLNGGGGGKISRIVLQNITIFSLEEKIGSNHLIDKVAKKKKEWTIHLLVTPNQGAILSSISSGAQLRLLLRNNKDEDIFETSPTVYTSSTGVISIDYASLDPSSLITPGMRAVTLKFDNTDGICGTLAPGDRVDIIFSSKAARFQTKGGNMAVGTGGQIFDVQKSSKILMQNIKVLTTQSALKSLIETKTPTKYITLSVTPSQAEKLALIADSSKSGKLKLIARNLEDTQIISTSGEFLKNILLKDSRAYRVVTILKGSKTFPVKFYVKGDSH